MMRRFFFLLLGSLGALTLSAQTKVYGDRIQQSGTTFDSTLAQHTMPFGVSAGIPGACALNEWRYIPGVSGALGSLSVCTAPNVWQTFVAGAGNGAGSNNATSLNGTSIAAFSGLLKLLNGAVSAAGANDIGNLFSGAGLYLRKDGSTDNGPTIPANTYAPYNAAGYTTPTQAAAVAPVQSVNGQSGTVKTRYVLPLTAATIYTVLGTTHNLGNADLTVGCRDSVGNSFRPGVFQVNPSTFAVSIQMAAAKSGGSCVIE